MARHLTIYERVNYKEYDKGAAYGTSFWLMVATCKYGGTCLQKKKSTEVHDIETNS